jgi:hypothetical protein
MRRRLKTIETGVAGAIRGKAVWGTKTKKNRVLAVGFSIKLQKQKKAALQHPLP